MTQTINTTLTNDTITTLDEVAESQSRTRDNIIQEAVDSYLGSLLSLGAEIQEARESIKAGHFISHDDIKAKYRALGVKC